MRHKLAFLFILLCGVVQYNQAGENQNNQVSLKNLSLKKYLFLNITGNQKIATLNSNSSFVIKPTDNKTIQFNNTSVHPDKIEEFNNFYNQLFLFHNLKKNLLNFKPSYYSPIALKTAQDGIKLLGGLVVANLLGIKTGPKIQIPLFTAALLKNIYKESKDYKEIEKKQLSLKQHYNYIVFNLIKEFEEELLYKSPLNELGFITQLLQCNDQKILSRLISQENQNDPLFKNGQKDFNILKDNVNKLQKKQPEVADRLIDFINNPFSEKSITLQHPTTGEQKIIKKQFLKPISNYEQKIEQTKQKIKQTNKEFLYKSMRTVGLFGLSCFAYNYQTSLLNLGLTGLKTIKKSITR